MSNFFGDFTPQATGQSNYTKLHLGDTKLRILSTPSIYFQGWTEEGGKNKPVRGWQKPQGVTWREEPKQAVGLVVWNYDTEQIEWWEVTQASIQQQLVAYASDPDFGDPREYDIKVTKSGTGMETKYNVRALTGKPLTPEITAKAQEAAEKLDVEGYMNGEAIFKA